MYARNTIEHWANHPLSGSTTVAEGFERSLIAENLGPNTNWPAVVNRLQGMRISTLHKMNLAKVLDQPESDERTQGLQVMVKGVLNEDGEEATPKQIRLARQMLIGRN